MSKSNVNMAEDFKKMFEIIHKNTIKTPNEYKIDAIMHKIYLIKENL